MANFGDVRARGVNERACANCDSSIKHYMRGDRAEYPQRRAIGWRVAEARLAMCDIKGLFHARGGAAGRASFIF